MRERRQKRLGDLYRDLASQFLEQESTRETIITVTRCELGSEGTSVKCLFTVFPEERQASTLAFARRRQGDFRNFVATHSKTKFVPTFTFELDLGEKNRQRIEELLKK